MSIVISVIISRSVSILISKPPYQLIFKVKTSVNTRFLRVFPILGFPFFFVFLCDFSYNLTRISGSYHMTGNVFCNDRTGTYHYIIAYRNAGIDHYISTNPHI